MTTAAPTYPIHDVATVQAAVGRHVDKWRDLEGNLIMILHDIQDEHGYVPREIAMELAQRLGLSLARIYEVVTFYHYFKLTPPGRHTVAVCTGTACYLKGATNILSEWENILGIKEGQTTADRAFHLETVRCLGCCGMSPAMMVDGKTHGRLRTVDIAAIAETTKHEEGRCTA